MSPDQSESRHTDASGDINPKAQTSGYGSHGEAPLYGGNNFSNQFPSASLDNFHGQNSGYNHWHNEGQPPLESHDHSLHRVAQAQQEDAGWGGDKEGKYMSDKGTVYIEEPKEEEMGPQDELKGDQLQELEGLESKPKPKKRGRPRKLPKDQSELRKKERENALRRAREKLQGLINKISEMGPPDKLKGGQLEEYNKLEGELKKAQKERKSLDPKKGGRPIKLPENPLEPTKKDRANARKRSNKKNNNT